jgi:hypothetical protein
MFTLSGPVRRVVFRVLKMASVAEMTCCSEATRVAVKCENLRMKVAMEIPVIAMSGMLPPAMNDVRKPER